MWQNVSETQKHGQLLANFCNGMEHIFSSPNFFYSLAAYGRRRKRLAQFDVKYRAFSTNWTAGPFVAKISAQYLYNILQISQILNCSPGADGESIVW